MTETWTPELRTRPHGSLSLRGGATAYVHPDLAVGVNPVKGRQVVAGRTIPRGEALLVDTPYALVPAMEDDEAPFRLCSDRDCHRRIPRTDPHVRCPRGCAAEVSWCSDTCRSRDGPRHAMECEWLRQLCPRMRAFGDAEFGLVWLIARIIIAKACLGDGDGARPTNQGDMAQDHFERRGWDAVWNLEGGTDSFPPERIAHWTHLTETYLRSSLLGARLRTTEETVTLICKVELNSFGLYPGVTGEYPVETFVSRGEYYGGGVYPTAAMFNHACCPNVTHRLDVRGRRIFEANRDIDKGEECCISYFDLVELSDTMARRAEIKKSWSFDCGCTRCVEEGEFELPHFLKEVDLF